MSRVQKLTILLICLAVSTVFTACILTQAMQDRLNGHYYVYKFATREATKKNSTTFANSIFTATFKPNFICVGYAIRNNTSSPLQVLWDKAYLVIQTDSCKVIPSTMALQEKKKVSAPLVIPAGQNGEGFITPVDYIKQDSGKWSVNTFYPYQDDELSEETHWIMGLLDVDMFKLYLPICSNQDTVTYKFTFYPIEVQKTATSPVPKQ